MRDRAGSAVLWFVVAAALLPGAAWGQPAISVGEPLPSLGPTLRQMDGTTVSPRSLGGEVATVFLFWSNRCPWVDRYESRVDSLATTYGDQGVRFVLVNANDSTERPQESPEPRSRAPDRGLDVPYVRDPNARLARTLGATRTPHAFVFGEDWTLRYAGAIDDSPSTSGAVGHAHLRNVVQALVSDREVSAAPQTAFGCTLNPPE
ncbi:MAG: redoxin family protein [Salinivenus sp.]